MVALAMAAASFLRKRCSGQRGPQAMLKLMPVQIKKEAGHLTTFNSF
jgi:hypothetical protein